MSLTVLERLELQKAKTLDDQVNIVLATNSFLFMPFATLVVGAKDLVGLFVLAPIIICAIGIGLNIGLIYYIYFAKDLKPLREFAKKVRGTASVIDSFKKYAAFLLLSGWLVCLVVACIQVLPGMIN